MSDQTILIIVGAVVLVILIAIFLGQRLRSVRIEVGAVKLEVAFQQASAAIQAREGRAPGKDELARLVGDLIQGRRILWVDDNPGNNEHELGALTALGYVIEQADTNEVAASRASEKSFDLVISDIGRKPPAPPTEGLNLPGYLQGQGIIIPPVIYYVMHKDGDETPDGYPVTNRPSELFALVANRLGGAAHASS